MCHPFKDVVVDLNVLTSSKALPKRHWWEAESHFRKTLVAALSLHSDSCRADTLAYRRLAAKQGDM